MESTPLISSSIEDNDDYYSNTSSTKKLVNTKKRPKRMDQTQSYQMHTHAVDSANKQQIAENNNDLEKTSKFIE
jgi:hypothetical protein